jgi:biotin synthase-like enzyme
LLEALAIARQDTNLPVKHAIISGGTPVPRDYAYYDEVCERVIKNTDIPVDVMMWPRPDDIIDRLADWGIHGYALNLEVYDEKIARRLTPQKRQYGRGLFVRGIERALQRTGGNGRVRSLILVGLEPIEKTLEGVKFLAQLGCDPALSPFRPAPGTSLEDVRPPSPEVLEHVYLESLEIVERYGVKLGPRCIPCQHNTLTFPDGSQAYYYS